MRLDVYVHFEGAGDQPSVLAQILAGIVKLKKGQATIMATQAQDAARVVELGGKLDKISGETTSLVEAVRALKDQAGQSSPEMTAAIDAVLGKADAIDALVDDIAPNPTPTPDA